MSMYSRITDPAIKADLLRELYDFLYNRTAVFVRDAAMRNLAYLTHAIVSEEPGILFGLGKKTYLYQSISKNSSLLSKIRPYLKPGRKEMCDGCTHKFLYHDTLNHGCHYLVPEDKDIAVVKYVRCDCTDFVTPIKKK